MSLNFVKKDIRFEYFTTFWVISHVNLEKKSEVSETIIVSILREWFSDGGDR